MLCTLSIRWSFFCFLTANRYHTFNFSGEETLRQEQVKMFKPQKLGYSLLLSLLLVSLPPLCHGDDLDRDDISDDLEESIAKSFMPWIWYWSNESCPEPGVILYHVRPFAPGGSTDTLAVTYLMTYYEDCGINGHQSDLEVFAVTLYPLDGSPSGYGAHSIATWAHVGTICEKILYKSYDPPRPDLEPSSDTIYSSWDTLWVSDDKHAIFVLDELCDPTCLFSDDCKPELVMNSGQLVEAEQGQSFHMYNIGEINDHLIENYTEINNMGGFSFHPQSIWGVTWIDEMFYYVSPGPELPVYFSVEHNSPYPNPVRKCADNSIEINLWYRSILRAKTFNNLGHLMKDEYIGELCSDEEGIRFHLWDGYDKLGNCLSSGPKLLELLAYRGADNYQATFRFDVAGDPVPKPPDPSDLTALLVEDYVQLSWLDNAEDEDGYKIERREGSCAYVYLEEIEDNPGTGTVQYEDHDIAPGGDYHYRVFATGEGGFSKVSNETPISVPACAEDPHLIVTGPEIDADSVYSLHSSAVTVEASDPDCPFLRYEWHVSGDTHTDPGTITGSGDIVTYLAPDIGCDMNDAPASTNKIDVTVSYQDKSDSASTGQFYIFCPPPGDPTGCPFLYVYDGSGFVPENNLLPLSEISRGDVTDHYLLTTVPEPIDGRYVLEIREDGHEHTRIDDLELLYVDHIPSMEAGVTQEGKIFLFGEATPPALAVNTRGENLLEALSEIDKKSFPGESGDEVHVKLGQSGSGIIAINALPQPNVKSFGPVIIAGQEGENSERRPHGAGITLPRHMGGLQFFEISKQATGDTDLDLSIVWTGGKGIDYIGGVTAISDEIRVNSLLLEDAIHSNQGDVREELLIKDNIYAELLREEKIRLFFKVPDVDAGIKRDFVLVVHGFYE
jgi:hypothetical protein